MKNLLVGSSPCPGWVQIDHEQILSSAVKLFGLSDSPWTTRSGTIRFFPRIRNASWTRTWLLAFFARILEQANTAKLLSDEHFTVDGTLIEAWASLNSFRPKDAPPPEDGGGRKPKVNFHGEKRRIQTHASTTDPEARLFLKGKGKEAKLCFMGHVLMENRHGLVISPRLHRGHRHRRTGGGRGHGGGRSRPAPHYRGRRRISGVFVNEGAEVFRTSARVERIRNNSV